MKGKEGRGREEEGDDAGGIDNFHRKRHATSGCTTSSLVRVAGEAASREGPAARRGEGERPGEPGGSS